MNLKTVICFVLATSLAYAQLAYDWSIIAKGSLQGQGGITISNVVTDSQGFIYIGAQYASQPVDITDIYGQNQLNLGAQSVQQGFVAKLSSNGSILWINKLTSDDKIVQDGLILTSDGGLVYSVTFLNQISINDSSGSTKFSANTFSFSDSDISITKIDANGVWNWTCWINSPQWDASTDLKLLQSDRIGIAFFYGTSFNLTDSKNVSQFLINSGSHDICLWVLNQDGSHAWKARLFSSGSDALSKLTEDSDGNIALGGNSQSAFLRIADSSGVTVKSFSQSKVYDSCVALFNKSGHYINSILVTGDGTQSLQSVGFDSFDNLIISVQCQFGTVQVYDATGNLSYNYSSQANYYSSLVIKFNSSLHYLNNAVLDMLNANVQAFDISFDMLSYYQIKVKVVSSSINIYRNDIGSPQTYNQSTLNFTNMPGVVLLNLTSNFFLNSFISSNVNVASQWDHYENQLYYHFDNTGQLFQYGQSGIQNTSFYDSSQIFAYSIPSTGSKVGFIVRAFQDFSQDFSNTAPSIIYTVLSNQPVSSSIDLSQSIANQVTVYSSSSNFSHIQSSILQSTNYALTSMSITVDPNINQNQQSASGASSELSQSGSSASNINLIYNTITSSGQIIVVIISQNPTQQTSLTTQQTTFFQSSVSESVPPNFFIQLTTDKNLIPIFYSVLSGVVVLILISVIVILKLKRSKKANYRRNLTKVNSLNTTSIFQSESAGQTLMNNTTLVGTQYLLEIPAFLNYRYGFDFRKLTFLASGGNGQIYFVQPISHSLIERVGFNQVVAKVVILQEGEIQQKIVDSFYQELSILYMFRDSPYFAKFYGYSNEPYSILLKYYELGSLKGLIYGKQGHIVYSKQMIVNLVLGISRGLKEFHGKGFIHCDLKPDNMLLDVDVNGHLFPVLTDFGISRLIDEKKSLIQAFKLNKLKGASIAYAAPEAITSFRNSITTSYDLETQTKVDIYSLSIVMLELLNRRAPYRFY